MNAPKLPLANQIAIVNWKEFHAAKLYKKRRVRDTSGCTKVSLLSAKHYVILNILRGLPQDRGLSEDAFNRAVSRLKLVSSLEPRLAGYELQPYAMPFGIQTYWLNGLLKANLK